MEYKARTFTFPEIKGLSKDQLALHIGLYEGYVKHVNLLHEQLTKLATDSETYGYAIAELRRRLGFEWNGMRLHELYFEALEDGPKTLFADTALYKALSQQYGSFSRWIEIFAKMSARGPGWAILNYDPAGGQFLHTWVADHDIGQLATLPAVLVLDHWEHAYMVDYKPSEKGEYVEAYLSAVNWETVSKRFDAIVK